MKLSEWIAQRLAKNLTMDRWKREALIKLQRDLIINGK